MTCALTFDLVKMSLIVILSTQLYITKNVQTTITNRKWLRKNPWIFLFKNLFHCTSLHDTV